MTRDTWNRLMIALMAAVIVFDLQYLWNPSDQEGRAPYLLSLVIAVVVIVLKIREINQNAERGNKPSTSK